MSKAYKCDICGDLFTDRIAISINDNEKAYLAICDHVYDVCPGCINTIQSTIYSLSKSNRVNISCDTCKFGPVNAVDYMRCHKCSRCDLWEAKE